MTQTTTLIATPDPDPEHDLNAVTCTAGLSWCTTECVEFGDDYHGSDFSGMTVKRSHGRRAGRDLLTLTVYRQDDRKNKTGKPKIAMITGDFGDQVDLRPARARQLAALLLNSADLADPLPLGVLIVQAQHVRLGDEILTDDGWQKVTGLLLMADTEVAPAGQASIFTPERNDEDSDGWQFKPATPVKVRRQINTGEPALNVASPFTAIGHCTQCRDDRLIIGTRRVSHSGVLRVRGCCQTCGTKQNACVTWHHEVTR